VGLAGVTLLALAVAAVAYVPILRNDTEVLQAEVDTLRTQCSPLTHVALRPTRRRLAHALLPTLDSRCRLRTDLCATGRHRVGCQGRLHVDHADDGSGVARLEVMLPIS
jgi:hypothetical protein